MATRTFPWLIAPESRRSGIELVASGSLSCVNLHQAHAFNQELDQSLPSLSSCKLLTLDMDMHHMVSAAVAVGAYLFCILFQEDGQPKFHASIGSPCD